MTRDSSCTGSSHFREWDYDKECWMGERRRSWGEIYKMVDVNPQEPSSPVTPTASVMEITPTQQSKNAWHLTCDDKTPTWYGASPGWRTKADITLLFKVEGSCERLSFTPVLPVRNQEEMKDWSSKLSDISRELHRVLNDLDPSVCLGEHPPIWRTRALNTLGKTCKSSVKCGDDHLRVWFSEAPEDSDLEPGDSYSQRTKLIRVIGRRDFAVDQADKFFCELPSDHKCYRERRRDSYRRANSSRSAKGKRKEEPSDASEGSAECDSTQ